MELRIETERLTLITLSAKLARAIAADDRMEIERLAGCSVPYGWPGDVRSIAGSYADVLEAHPATLGWGPWLITETHGGCIVGDGGFHGPPNAEGVEIGYMIAPEFRLRGYAFEASRGLVDWALTHENVQHVLATCDANNVGSIKVLERAGFERVSDDGTAARWIVHSRAQSVTKR